MKPPQYGENYADTIPQYSTDRNANFLQNQSPRELLFCRLMKAGFKTLSCANCHSIQTIDKCINYYEEEAYKVETQAKIEDSFHNNKVIWAYSARAYSSTGFTVTANSWIISIPVFIILHIVHWCRSAIEIRVLTLTFSLFLYKKPDMKVLRMVVWVSRCEYNMWTAHLLAMASAEVCYGHNLWNGALMGKQMI